MKGIKICYFSCVWWCTLIIPALRRLRQEKNKFEVSLAELKTIEKEQMRMVP
jgi:hypothetical protein